MLQEKTHAGAETFTRMQEKKCLTHVHVHLEVQVISPQR